MRPVEKVLEHVEGVVEKRGGGFKALCPAHDDHNPSLHIDEGNNGSALVKCWAGCDKADVLDALEHRGLQKRDLFLDSGSVVPLAGRSKAPKKPGNDLGRLIKSYTIKDASRRPKGVHERWENGEKKSFLWKHPDGRYSRNGEINPETMPLYGSELVADWPKDYRIVLSEGEGPAEALRDRNIRALGTACGASMTPRPEALEIFRGRRVVVWPDGDEAGREHMRRTIRHLRGVAASVQIYEWPDPPEGVKGPDAADHPAIKGGDREDLKALIRNLQDAPEAPDEATEKEPVLRDRTLLGKIMAEGVEPPEELVADVLLAGKVHSLYSAASTGKTFLMLWLVLRVIEQGLRVLVYDRENGPRIMSERLEALGADPEKVDELVHYAFYPELPTTEEGLLEYEHTLDEIRPALVVFDSLIGFLATNGLDENSSNDVSTWAAHYAHPARGRGAAVLILDHVPKEGASSRGSSRKRDEVDVMWALRNPLPFDRDTVGRVVLQREKDREGWLPESVGFSVGGGAEGFVFSRSAGTIEAEGDDGLTPSARKSLEALEDLGEKGATASEWQREAEKLNVARRTFYRAKAELDEKGRISLENKRFSLKGATGAKQVPRHQMAPAPDEVPLVPPPLGVAPSGTGGDTGESEDDFADLADMFADDEKGAG